MKSCGLKIVDLLKCLLLYVRTSNDKKSVNLLLQSSKCRTCFLSPADKIIATIDLLPKLFGSQRVVKFLSMKVSVDISKFMRYHTKIAERAHKPPLRV